MRRGEEMRWKGGEESRIFLRPSLLLFSSSSTSLLFKDTLKEKPSSFSHFFGKKLIWTASNVLIDMH